MFTSFKVVHTKINNREHRNKLTYRSKSYTISQHTTTMIVTSLPDALLSKCFSFVGEGHYIYVAGTCRSFCDAYKMYLQQTEAELTATNFDATVESVARLQMKLIELNIDVQDHDDKLIIELYGKKVLDFWIGVIRRATYKGNLDVLVWKKNINPGEWHRRVDRNRYFSKSVCSVAARGGQLKVLQWLRSENGGKCHWAEATSRVAASEGHIELLKWAHQNGCPWNEGTCTGAARNGNLELLKWVRKKGCPWDAGMVISSY